MSSSTTLASLYPLSFDDVVSEKPALEPEPETMALPCGELPPGSF